jgi:hypothetical protein
MEFFLKDYTTAMQLRGILAINTFQLFVVVHGFDKGKQTNAT